MIAFARSTMDRRHERSGQYLPGVSGNPRGRPKGARNRLGEEFLLNLADDFEQHGSAVIAQVREERPHEYLKVIASLLPKELKVQSPVSEMTEEELDRRIMQLTRALGLDLVPANDCEREGKLQ